jgi:uncharacterized membrane protein
MQGTKADTPQLEHVTTVAGRARGAFFTLDRLNWRESVPYIYLAVTLPVALLLCFITPPMQSPDEGRHFLRACQIAQGRILSQIDPATHAAGGWLPAAASEFVRDKMTPEYLRRQDSLSSVRERLQALDRAAQAQAPLSESKFASFPGAAVYSPASYLPQSAAIRAARFFSDKVYIWFYSARLLNATIAVLLIFFALRMASAYQFALIVPAILPVSLYQISTVSSDAGIIAVSILFVAFCVRFVNSDGALIRPALVVCLFFLTIGKPVYLPFAILLLAAHKRLGWRRSVGFCSAAAIIAASGYVAWSYLVSQFIPLAGAGFPRHDPSAQVHFLAAHTAAFVPIVLNTLKWHAYRVVVEMIGLLGWNELPLPPWLYKFAYVFFSGLAVVILANSKRNGLPRFLLGGIAAAAVAAAVFLASFVLWTPVGAATIWGIQGRYFVPVLAMLAFFIPPVDRLSRISKNTLAALALGFFVVCAFTTVRITKHYFFPDAKFLGGNVHSLFTEMPARSCPAALREAGTHGVGWFTHIANGLADVSSAFQVLVANEDGTIVAKSDPALAGADFPYVLLPGLSRSNWRVRIWTPNQFTILHYWLITGENACMFGPDLKLTPYPIPDS